MSLEEMATIGDPLMDLGNSLGYWIEADDPQQMQLLRRQKGFGMVVNYLDSYLQQQIAAMD